MKTAGGQRGAALLVRPENRYHRPQVRFIRGNIPGWGGKMTDYALDNSWDRARRRLSLLEQYLDPMTKRRMTALGIRHGLRCLEVGAGGGSVAAWLCEQIGPTGRVIATDINIELLRDINLPNFEAVEHDITRDDPPESGFDLVHTRWLLHHLSDPELAIRRMIRALRPGGWLLLEDIDFFPVHTSASKLYVDFMVALSGTIVRRSGRGCFWGRALPGLVADMGLRQVGGEGDFFLLQGGSPIAEFFSLTAEQMREQIIESGDLSANRLDEALALLKSPNFWAFGGGGVAVWGQRH
jgi:SAM-dependent methyltransferase